MTEPREDEIIVRYSMLDNLLFRARSAEAKLDTHYLIPKELIEDLRGYHYGTGNPEIDAVINAVERAK